MTLRFSGPTLTRTILTLGLEPYFVQKLRRSD
jgi:hypothetical protein